MKNLLFSLSFLAIFSCDKTPISSFSSSKSEGATADMKMISIDENSIEEVSYNSPIPPNAETNSLKSDITFSKKLIKNGDMGIAVSNINDAKKQVNQILKENKAYTQNEQFRNLETEENLHLIIRVPHQNFDALINSFSNGIGAVEYKNISTDDVTEEYTNVSIKLENK